VQRKVSTTSILPSLSSWSVSVLGPFWLFSSIRDKELRSRESIVGEEQHKALKLLMRSLVTKFNQEERLSASSI
jgi:hypothetical protein